MNSTKKIIDVKDGKEVADMFLGRYLNSFSYGIHEFIHHMKKEEQEIQDNFTYLIFAWFQELSKVKVYDKRNEASVTIAKRICSCINEQPPFHKMKCTDLSEVESDYRDVEQMEKLMALYLVIGSESAYKDFIRVALTEHRTLQQNMTRLFMNWLEENKTNHKFVHKMISRAGIYALPSK